MKGLADDASCSVALLDGAVALGDVVENHIYEQTMAEKSMFFVADLGVVMRRHVLWQTHMTQIRPHYTVRCNTSPAVIELLAALGTGFVCANKSELELVLGFGVPSEDIVYSGVCKQLSQIKYAAKNGINLLVCDNEAELRKIARCHPSAKLLLQVATEASSQGEELAVTPGSSLKECRHLLDSAKELGLQVVGARFHIPASCDDPEVYTHAVSDARCVFDMGEDVGFSMKVLDIGGGFSGSEDQLQQIEGAVRPLMQLYFPASSGVSVVAEPGAFFVSSAFTLAVNIVAKEVVSRDRRGQSHDEPSANDEPEFLYYMSDGVYGSFASKLTDALIPAPTVHKGPGPEEPVFSSSLWGPSGDDLDQVVEQCLLPELSVGDWLLFPRAGAYGLGQPCSSSPDSDVPPVYYFISTGDWFQMQEAGVTQEITVKSFSLIPYFLHSSQSEGALSVPA
ncbi:antizyme inhibitor 1-like [Osmerus eperlanus]|uniref:antizyme inhibitor 1-like n=1 Tax=Osmerus eperlanus TaxID=29151 RepID=UPI002E10FA04